MLILLPPSEGKTLPAAGDPVDLDALAFADSLSECRATLLDALERLGDRPVGQAVKRLGISPRQAGEVRIDAALRSAPAAPAGEVYSGVLYDHLDLSGLPAAARRRAADRVLIASALWGFVRPSDHIPYYRLSAKARLARIGPLAKWWRPALTATMPDEDGDLIIDMRSAAYATAWKPKRATLLAVGAYTEQGGGRKPVTHMAKAIRGEVARALLLAKRPPADLEGAAAIVAGAGFEVDHTTAGLDIVVTS